jgi:ribonuclease T2
VNRALAALLLFAFSASPALAQTACKIPPAISAPPAERIAPSEIVQTKAAYYVLSLSWSPEWCRTRANSRYDTLQCRDNKFGWVLHGLWPNATSGPHPAFCKPATQLKMETLRRHLCMTPSAYLLQHEWTQHGACAWPTPEAYLNQAAALWASVKRPSPAHLATAGAVRDAFAAANPSFPRSGVFVGTESGRLSEVRLCYDLAMKPRACPQRGAPDTVKIAVTP